MTNDQKEKASSRVKFSEEPSKFFINYYEFLQLAECKADI